MMNPIDMRCILEAEYMLENNATLRQTAEAIGVTKSTVHIDMTVRLAELNPQLYRKIADILSENKRERASRGGLALKNKRERERLC